MDPRYPDLRVVVRSRSALGAVAAVRQALRRSGASRCEIARFSDLAFSSPSPARVLEVCRQWVRLEGPAEDSTRPPRGRPAGCEAPACG